MRCYKHLFLCYNLYGEIMNIFIIMLIALSSTLFIEFVGAYILGIRNKIDFINVGLVNILTNPLVVSISFFMNITYGVVYRRIALFILEVLAFVIEGYIYDKVLSFKKYNGFTISFVLNILSFGLGILINKIIY